MVVLILIFWRFNIIVIKVTLKLKYQQNYFHALKTNSKRKRSYYKSFYKNARNAILDQQILETFFTNNIPSSYGKLKPVHFSCEVEKCHSE